MDSAGINQAVGSELRAARARHDWTREELEARSGVSVSSIRRYERGERSVPASTLIQLLTILKINLDDISQAIQRAKSADDSEAPAPLTAAGLDALSGDAATELEVDGIDDERDETG